MRLAWLDYARVFAAAAAWLFHLKILTYGYLGVPLFFAISGYVISISRENRRAVSFAIQRFARLWPAFLICLVLTSFVAKPDIVTWLANATMVPRFLRQPYVDGVYWSLMIEIIFYAWVAVLGARWLKICAPWWLLLSAAHLLWPLPFSTFLVLDWAAFFVVGIAARHRLRWLGVVAACVSAWAAAEQTRFDPVIAGGLVFAVAAAFPLLCRPATSRMASVGAAMSYPVYLLHHIFGSAFGALQVPVVLAAAWLVTLGERHAKRYILALNPYASKRAAADGLTPEPPA